MKTVVIRLRETGHTDDAGEKDYEVVLYAAGGDPARTLEHLATTPLPGGLLPEVKPAGGGEPPFSRTQMREIFANEAGYSMQFRAIGEYLHHVLFRGDVATAWNDLRQRYPGEFPNHEGLRAILDIEPRELQSLPWELLARGNDRLFLDPTNPFVRGQVDFARPVTTHTWPLRVMIVVAAKPKDKYEDERIDAEKEVGGVMYSLRQISRTIEVSVVRQPSLTQLTQKYKSFEPHIFHFIGHGGSVPVGKGERKPCLFLSDAAGAPREWLAEEIGNGLKGTWAASLAFINACRSGDKITAHETSAITEGFADARIPAVLGMTGDIKEEAAQAFSDGLYRALAEGLPLDCALAAARQRLIELNGFGLGYKQWALASLSLSVPPDKVVHIHCPIEDDLRLQIRDDTEFSKLKTFIDRVDERASLIKNIDPDKNPESAKSLLLVRGQSEVGKSWFVRLCLECCAMRGRQFILVDMRGMKTQTFVDVLRLIRDGNPDSGSLLHQPLRHREAFNRFNWELGSLLEGDDPPEMPARYVVEAGKDAEVYEEDEISKKKKAPNKDKCSPRHLQDIFTNFCDALRMAAGDQPLIIALDHLKIEPNDFDEFLVPLLIEKIKKHQVRPVRMILVLSPGDETNYNLKRLGAVEDVPLSLYSQDDFEPFVYEFLRYNEIPLSEKLKTVIKDLMALGGIEAGWKPAHLNTYLLYSKTGGTTA